MQVPELIPFPFEITEILGTGISADLKWPVPTEESSGILGTKCLN